MSAKKIFKKLGFELDVDTKMHLAYKGKYEEYDCWIVFNKLDMSYYAFALVENEKKFLGINIKEHKAIDKQLQELGWE